MPVWGFCETCECLKPARPTAQKLGSRECEWRPFPHDVTYHLGCEGVVDDGTCRKCGAPDVENVRSAPCGGHTRDIQNHKQAVPPLESLVSS